MCIGNMRFPLSPFTSIKSRSEKVVQLTPINCAQALNLNVVLEMLIGRIHDQRKCDEWMNGGEA